MRIQRCLLPLVLSLAAPVVTLSARPVHDSRAVDPAVMDAWKAVSASGSVQARPAAAEQAAWRSVTRGDELMPETTVETGRRGRVTLTRDANVLIVDPGSRVDLPPRGRSAMETSIVQTQGSVLYKVEKRSTPHFEVVTPYLVAGVKGTSFLVTVNDRYAAVTVETGRVEVTDPGTGDRVTLEAGDSVVRHRDDAEMELVRDDRRDPDLRKEVRRLDRMTTRTAVSDAPAELDVDTGKVGAEPTTRSDDAWDDKDTTETLDLLGSSEEDAIAREVEELTRELIEEMINEGLKDGSISSRDDQSIKPPPADPTLP